ncbi:uncharacterized protein [Apostichopus japonicus]|uniref:uncharacterized protein isoform X2 n=1 Tax=Stichopus japonicus TaxID=307972 RepID=UPI003AB2505E
MEWNHKGILLFLALVLSLYPGLHALDECPDQRWFKIEGDCFLFVVTPSATFQDAVTTCQNQAEFAVLAKINPVDPKYRLFLESRPLTGIFAPQFLIGLSDTVTEGEFRWLDGTWPTEVNWAEGHPVRISREVEDRLDCVIINDAGQWESVQCIQSYSFVCAVLDGTVPGTEFNECAAPGAAEQICLGPNDFCEDAAAGYHCVCFPGYRKNDNNQCEDIDECASNPCVINEECTNLPGSFSCACLPGHTPADVDVGCIDINECDDAVICVGFEEVCSNFDGGFTCECNQGFLKDDRNICVDVDECSDAINPCTGLNEICMNTPGGHVCLCERYFSLDANGDCVADDTCCPSGFELIGGNCHIVIDMEASHTDASDFCIAIGGFLSKIDPLDAVTQYILENFPADSLGVWIGLNDMDNEGIFKWVSDGSVVGTLVNRWGEGQPQSVLPSLDCVFMTIPPSGTWHTTQCSPTIRYSSVCQRPTITECPPVNPCEAGNPCPGQFDLCNFEYGQHTCTCQDGFRKNAVTQECEDINECDGGDFCTTGFQMCNNLIGSYECTCRDGTTLIDGLCQDVNECELDNPCTGNRDCTNTLGSYRCTCSPGFEVSFTDCIDINECARDPNVCSRDGEECTNLEGSFRCDNVTCLQGFRREGRECFDIDECLLNPCIGNNEFCENTIGSYQCLCIDGTDRDINNNCVGVCCPDGTIAIGNYCYQIRNDPEDIIDFNTAHRICQTSIANSTGSLAQLDDSFRLLTALAQFGIDGDFWIGFEKDPQNNQQYRWLWDRTFVSLNPMLWRQGGPVQISGLENCGSVNLNNFLMDNLYCQLSRPFLCQHRQISCDNTNQCETANPCVDVPNTQCVYESGQILCICQVGFQYDDTTRRCVDVECTLMDPDSCSEPNEICYFSTVHVRSYYCDCLENYQRGTDGICVDIDECAFTTCPGLNRQCVNTDGSYVCNCRDGFLPQFDGECLPETHICESNPCQGTNIVCIDQLNNFVCSCDPGYELVTATRCEDINECDEFPIRCPANSVCVNLPGSHRCDCLDGYTMDEAQCKDINECTMSPCTDPKTECINLSGTYSCVCRTGFFLDPNGDCQDIIECNDPTICTGENQVCLNNEGSYRCVCADGFDNINGQCVMNLEFVCRVGNNPCSDAENEICVNVNGAAVCECKQGFFQRNGMCIAESACNADPNLCTSTQLCVDTALAEYRCDCLLGFVRNEQMNDCVAADICTSDATLCSSRPNEVCVSLDLGAHECVCREFFEMLNGECTAVDVCVSSLSSLCGLNEVCEPLGIGQFQCVCQPGFVRVNENSCEAESACSVASVCSVNEVCTDIAGSPFCECIPGYSRQDGVCQEDTAQNPCISMPDICDANQDCIFREASGSIVCVCIEGYVDVGGVCQLQGVTNPCDDPNRCSTNERCTEMAGLAVCDCIDGYSYQNGVCQLTVVNPCEVVGACDINEDCTVVLGQANCECQAGYTRISETCQLATGCSIPDICGENEECLSLQGGSITCNCITGFTRQGGQCVEIFDPCAAPDACGVNEDCVNAGDQAQCSCIEGFSMQAGVCQEIIDPCLNPNTCEVNEVCVANNGQAVCNCADGFVRQNDGTCQVPAADPCDSRVCGVNEGCINVNGVPGCACSTGFSRRDGACIDSVLTQCPASSTLCDTLAEECEDNNGFFFCTCVGGFVRAGLTCVPEGGECVIGSNDCTGTNIQCAPVFGIPVCECVTGFAKNSAGDCVATTPGITCNIGSNDCGVNEICIEQLLNNVCICQENYVRDINNGCVFTGSICEVNPNICPSNANCVDDANEEAGYRCDCVAGLVLTANGGCEVEMTDVCLAMPDLCPGQFEVCNTGDLNTYSCDCVTGYWRLTTGAECTAINPCTMNPCIGNFEECQQDTNTANGYNCVCLDGYERSTATAPCTATSIQDPCNPNPCTGNFEVCASTNAGFACNCIEGYTRSAPSEPCIVNPCNANPCNGANEVCVVQTGGDGFACNCQVGFSRNSATNLCEGIACDAMCSGQNEFCLTRGPPNDDSCECLPGFVRTNDGLHCVSANVDETCTSNSDLCNTADLICQDGTTVGEYRCECIQGFVRETSTGNCIESSFTVSTCAMNPELCNGFREQCIDGELTGSYVCECQGGYAYVNGVCTEQAACVGSPCTVDSEVCVDLPEGRYRCDCATGYTRRDGVCTIFMLTKCNVLLDLCLGVNEVCIDTPDGEHRCDCAPGHVRFPDGECKATCAVGVVELCGENADCIETLDNTVKYRCDCHFGHIKHEGRCFVSPTCSSDPNPCAGMFEVCVDLSDTGTYRCDCEEFYHRVEGVCTVRLDCCPIEGTYIDGTCYQFFNVRVSFAEAQSNCSLAATAGHLAKVVPNQALETFMRQGIQQLDLFFAWIGLTSSREWGVLDNQYTWLSDRLTVPRNHPSWRGINPMDPCVSIDQSLAWTSVRCDLPQPFLCQYQNIRCVDPPDAITSNECENLQPCDEEQNQMCVDTPQSYICNCKESTQQINGRCLYTEAIESEVKMLSINNTLASFTRPISDQSTSEFKQLEGFFCDVLMNALTTTSTNALTRPSTPLETDCVVSTFESGSIIAAYRVRVGEETPTAAADSIMRFENTLMEIVTEREQILTTRDGTGNIAIAKVIRDDCDRITCVNDGVCLVRAVDGIGYCECPSGYDGDFCEVPSSGFLFYDLYWFGWVLFGIPVVIIIFVSVICFCCVQRKHNNTNRNSSLQTVVTLPSLRRDGDNPQNQPLVNDMDSVASTPEEERRKKRFDKELRTSQLFNKQQDTSAGGIPLKKQPPQVAPKPLDKPRPNPNQPSQVNAQGPSGAQKQPPVVNTQGPSGVRSGRSPQRNPNAKGRKPSPSPSSKSRTNGPPTKQAPRGTSPSPQKARPKGPETGSLKKGPETGSLRRDPKKVPEKGSLDRNQNRASQRSNQSRTSGRRPQGGQQSPRPANGRPQRSPSRASQSSVNSKSSPPVQGQPRGRPTSQGPPGGRAGQNPEGRRRSPAPAGSRSPNNRVKRKINGGKVPKPHKGPETAPTIYI